MIQKNLFHVIINKKKNKVTVRFSKEEEARLIEVVPGVELNVNQKGEILGVEILPANSPPVEVFEDGVRRRSKKSR